MTEHKDLATCRTELAEMFDRKKESILAMIPAHLDRARVLHNAFTVCMKDTKLAQCNAHTVIGAVVEACRLGLEIGGWLGQCYVLPFGGKAQFLCGYKGLAELAWRSGEIAGIHKGLVRCGDDFDYSYGFPDGFLRHRPADRMAEPSDAAWQPKGTPPPSEAISHAWVGFKTVKGDFVFHVSDMEEILRSRKRSASWRHGQGPWHDHFDEMCPVVPFRKMKGQLPATPQLDRALALSEAAEDGRDQKLEESAEEAPDHARGMEPGAAAAARAEAGQIKFDPDDPEFKERF